MDTKKWKALVTAVDLGSFSKAAELLGCTQSGLTHMMKTLEQEVGVRLLTRGFDGIRLTSDGEKLLPAVRSFLDAGTALEKRARELSDRPRDTRLRLGTYESMRLGWLPGVLDLFREKHPEAEVEVRSGSVDEIFSWVENDLIDVGCASRQSPMHCGWVPLWNDPLRVVVPRSDPLGEQDVIPLTALGGKVFLMPSLGFDKDILRALNRPKSKPIIRTTLVDDATVLKMVEAHEGVTMLSELVLRGMTGQYRALSTDPAYYRELGLAVSPVQDQPALVTDFIACAQTFTEKMTQGA